MNVLLITRILAQDPQMSFCIWLQNNRTERKLLVKDSRAYIMPYSICQEILKTLEPNLTKKFALVDYYHQYHHTLMASFRTGHCIDISYLCICLIKWGRNCSLKIESPTQQGWRDHVIEIEAMRNFLLLLLYCLPGHAWLILNKICTFYLRAIAY